MRETNRAKAAFEDYFLMGPGRSLGNLVEQYRQQTDSKPPTVRLRTLYLWSSEHEWQKRVGERQLEIAGAQFNAIKEKAEEAGYAFWPKRVLDLIDLAEMLLAEIYIEDKRWVPDVKQIGAGEFAERVDIKRFNSPLIQQYRQTLDDIAAEMGERLKSVAITGKDGGPLAVDFGAAARDKLLSALLSTAPTEGDREADKPANG